MPIQGSKTDNIKKDFIDRQVKIFSESGEGDAVLIRHKKIIDLVLKYSSKDDYILDVGCFDGKILKALEKVGYHNLFGVDFSEASKKSFIGSKIHFAPCDIEKEEIPFKQNFDVIIFSDVLEHLFSPQTTIFDIRKKLSSNAKIIFSVPNAGWFLNGFLFSFLPSKLFISTAFGPWGHTYNFTFYQIVKIAKNLKLKIIELSGEKMDNYAFKKGFKKVLFDLFCYVTYPLALLNPQLFSAHIFGVLRNSKDRLADKERFELGA